MKMNIDPISKEIINDLADGKTLSGQKENFDKNTTINIDADGIGPKTPELIYIMAEAIKSLDKDSERIIRSIYFTKETPFVDLKEVSNNEEGDIQKTSKDEQKAVRQLRHPRISRSLNDALSTCEDEIWSFISNKTGIVLEKDFRDIKYSLPGPLVLAIRCLYDDIRNWLSTTGIEMQKGWYHVHTIPYPSSLVEEKASWLDNCKEKLHLPTHLRSLSKVLDIEEGLLKLAVLLSDKITTIADYVAEYPIRGRTLRAIRFHKIMKERYEGKVVAVSSLREDYLLIYNDDQFSFIDAENSMKDASSLFQRTNEFGWCGIGLSIDSLSLKGDRKTDLDEKHSGVFYRKGNKTKTARSLVIELMRKKTVNRFNDIVTCWEGLNKNRYSIQNVGIVLRDEDLFIHLAPSLFALKEKWIALDSMIETSDLLLTPSDCRRYVISRYAGNPMYFYPLWTPAMERKWCIWGKLHLDQKLFKSLLFVSDPHSWTASEEEKGVWIQYKRTYEHYELLQSPQLSDDQKSNKLLSLFIIAKCAEWKRNLNWVFANRALGRVIDDCRMASLFALLIGTEALLPGQHWQQQHECGPYLSELISMLDNELHLTSKLQWSGKAGQTILSRLRSYPSNRKLGWVNNNGLQLLPINLEVLTGVSE